MSATMSVVRKTPTHGLLGSDFDAVLGGVQAQDIGPLWNHTSQPMDPILDLRQLRMVLLRGVIIGGMIGSWEASHRIDEECAGRNTSVAVVSGSL